MALFEIVEVEITSFDHNLCCRKVEYYLIL